MEKERKNSYLFTLSASSECSLQHATLDLKAYLERNNDIQLEDLSHTLTARRSRFQWRSSILSKDIDSLIQSLAANELTRNKAPKQVANVFVFTGQGAQSARMGFHLLSAGNTEFIRSIRRSEEILSNLGAHCNLVEELSRDSASSRLDDSRYGQPASTAVQLALVDLLRSWNVQPTAVVGHSSGEIAAAFAAGCISQETAIRISYHRSFLAQLSKERASQSGAMLAVGLGHEEVEMFLKQLDADRVTVACINSPSSTTISGDASVIQILKNALDADGIFARQLPVDTAYHSHHMMLVSSDYEDKLEGMEHSSPSPSIRFFSTVTGEEKREGFEASYWVKNLVSPVQFSAALQNAYRKLGQVSLNVIEIGPHKALSGPVRQTLAELQVSGSPYTYIPTLLRGENSMECLMQTASSLFVSGADVDVGKVASLNNSCSSQPAVLRDLPSYHWNHTTTYWTESRLSRDHRCRKHAAHDLLGSRVLESTDGQPSWRILLSIESLPWLGDHVVDNFVVFPAAGYMTMAIQALQQLNQDTRPGLEPTGYRLTNVAFKKALTIPKDCKSVETMMSFRYVEANDSWGFTVSSISGQRKWQEHCDGTISTVFETGFDEVEQGREAMLRHDAQMARLASARQNCTEIVSHGELYAQMAAMGNNFGPSFARISEARLASSQSVNILKIPDITGIMPGNFLQPHVVHPATLDAAIQTCLPVFQQHSVRGSVMPVFIGDMFISAKISNIPGEELVTVCELNNTFSHSTNFDTSVFQKEETGEPQCVLTLEKGEIRIVGESPISPQKLDSSNIYKLEWGIEISSITAAELESTVIPLQSDEAGISQAEKVDLCSIACARYIDMAVREMHQRGLVVKDDHRVNWWRLLEDFFNSDTGQALIQRSPKNKNDLDELTSRLGVEGEAIARIGPELVPLLTGETDPLAHFLKDDLLFRVYHSDEGARPNRYMADYVRHLTFQKRDLRILEIGAGTGGTTFQVLRACSPNGQDFCSQYMYTDISSGFFEVVRTSRLKDWAHLLTFQTLDLEKESSEQGFEEYSYDLVIAANVVHATRSLAKSLATIHKLLKPGGMIGLVELTRTTPYINMTFGSIPGWWAGVDEGRTDSPLQSSSQWDTQLRKAGFSGVDLAAYDLPEPERHCALLLSTALAIHPTTNGHGSGTLKILESTDGNLPSSDLSRKLSDGLINKGFDVSCVEWTDTAIDESCSYVILDSAQKPLLTQGSSEHFNRVRSLLSKATKVYWICLADGSNGIVPENSLMMGLSRTARNENPYLKCFTIDVQDSLSQHTELIPQAITSFIASTAMKIENNQPLEYELMYRNGKMHIQRLVPDDSLCNALSTGSDDADTDETLLHQDNRPLRISVDKPGLLSSLVFVDDMLDSLGPDEVEIKSYAWGLNFSDVFIALGQLPPTQPMVGESAGVITAVGANFTSKYKVGDRVTAMFGTPYASRTRTNGHLIHHIADCLSFADAASIPLTFATAYYSLLDCANLQHGQTVLIHSATGALGQAAIKIAQRLGATIFATVGSSSKAQLLKDQYGILESHIFSNRTADFASGLKRLTNGVGVDVVLNSLSGPMLHASWECVAAFGTFVEVGKTDISRHSQLSMKPFERNLRFMSVDLVTLSRQRPAYCQTLLKKIFADLDAGLFTPLPITTMAIGDIEKAFRLMQSRKHTGKLVLEATNNSIVQAKAQSLRLRADGTYIVVGGLGSLGRHICRHLQAKGARHIILFSRNEYDDLKRNDMEKELTVTPGIIVKIVTCDVGDANLVSRVADELLNSMPPVRGILHGGMVLSVCLN